MATVLFGNGVGWIVCSIKEVWQMFEDGNFCYKDIHL